LYRLQEQRGHFLLLISLIREIWRVQSLTENLNSQVLTKISYSREFLHVTGTIENGEWSVKD
jgi:hypothetical protein